MNFEVELRLWSYQENTRCLWYDIPNQTISEWKRDAEIVVNKRKIRYTEKEVYKLEQENKILKEELQVGYNR